MTNANISFRDLRRCCKNNGYTYTRQNGNHQMWSDGVNTITIPVVNLKPVIVNKIIKQYGLVI